MNPIGIHRVFFGLLTLLLVMATVAVPRADAHSGDQSYLYLNVTETDLQGRLELPFAFVREDLGLTLVGDADAVTTELAASAAMLESYAADHVEIGAAGQRWTLEFDGVTRLTERAVGENDIEYVLIGFTTDPPTENIPRELEIRLDPFFDGRESEALLLVENDWAGGVIGNEEESLVRFTSDSRSQVVDLGSSSQWNNFRASVAQGLNHIETGADHILFVLVLLLPSVLIFTTAWKPAPSFGSALWRVLKVVSAFTLAHTITFTLVGIDVLPLPSARITESVIALSIAAAALHNLRPVLRTREWIVAFAFGLFHGMGFASLITGLDVSRSTQLISLLGRNIGIELGQALVVLISFPALFALSRTRWYRPVFNVASIGLIIISLGLIIERVFEINTPTSEVINRMFSLPRILWIVLALSILSFAVYGRERARGELLDTNETEAAPAERPVVGVG